MVSPYCELAALQSVVEVFDGQINSKKLAVEGTIFHLCRRKFLREERKRRTVHVGKDSANSHERGICRQGQPGVWVRVSQGNGVDQGVLGGSESIILAAVQRSGDFWVGTEETKACNGARVSATWGMNR